MDSKNVNSLTSPMNILSGLQNTIKQLLDDITWGKATHQSVLTLEDVENWFYDLPSSVRQKIDRGVVIRIDTIDEEDVSCRIYQGVFDNKWHCFGARQVKVKEISKDLEKFFAGADMLTFAKDSDEL